MLERPIFEGDLRRIQIADVLSFVAMIRSSGKLVLRQARLERTLHWIEGEIVFASSNSPDQSLGQFLLRNGKITQQQYAFRVGEKLGRNELLAWIPTAPCAPKNRPQEGRFSRGFSRIDLVCVLT